MASTRKIGTSVISLFTPFEGANPITARVKKAYQGPDTDFTVYSGELYVILIAMEIIEEDDSHRTACIFRDGQAAIMSSVESPRQQSGQYILRDIVENRLIWQRKGIYTGYQPMSVYRRMSQQM